MAGHPFLDSVKKLLFVDSDREFREQIHAFLEQTGRFEVIACPDEASGLEALRANPRVDLILADHRMVGRGSEFAQTTLRFGIPVIILTGNFDEAVQALRLYALKLPVVKKPVEPAKLLELLDHYLHGRPLSGSPVLSAWWEA